MKDLIGKVVFIEFYGEGYYSGASESQSAFVTKEFFEEHKDEIEGYTPYFSELDGKHSGIEGDVKITFCETEENLKHALKTMTEQDGDWMIWDSCLDGVDGVSKQIEFSDNIFNKISK
jgi:hypothetical protein